MKALSFLGTGKYEKVTYFWKQGDEERFRETHLFPEAICHIFEPDKLFVLVTPQAKAYENFKALCERLGTKVESVDIPEGKSEEELWQIFEKCAEVVEQGDEILLDITHAFRSLPLIVFGVAAYLRRTKNVTIHRIVYGAYEARDDQNRAPIFDLTPLLDLLDWLSGAEAFIRRSDATLLAERLEEIHTGLWKAHASHNLPQHLQNTAKSLRQFSQALHLSRPRDVMREGAQLLTKLDKAQSEVEQWAKPFGVILEQVRREVEKLAYGHHDHLDAKNLRKQAELIRYLAQKGLLVQALTLAREWVVNWVAFQRGESDWLNRDKRVELEKGLGAAAARAQGKQEEVPAWLDQLPQSQEVGRLWSELGDLRNDVAHCGMKKQPASITSIKKKAQEILQRLQTLLESISDRSHG